MKNFGRNLGKRYADIKSNDKKGFSLIELVVVIAIMAILALIMVPNLTAYVQKADDSKVQANLKNVHTAAEMVYQTTEHPVGSELFYREVSNFTNIPEAEFSTLENTNRYTVSAKDGILSVLFRNDKDVYKFDGSHMTKDKVQQGEGVGGGSVASPN